MRNTPIGRRLIVAVAAAAIALGWPAARAAAQNVEAKASTSMTQAASAQVEAPSGSTSTVRLTLEEAMARALSESHRIGEGRARQDAAEAAVGSRAAATMPIVSVMAGYTRTNHIVPFGIPPEKPTAIIYPDIPDNYRTRLDLQWPVYTFGRLESMERAARSEAAAAAKDVGTFTADVRLDIEPAA